MFCQRCDEVRLLDSTCKGVARVMECAHSTPSTGCAIAMGCQNVTSAITLSPGRSCRASLCCSCGGRYSKGYQNVRDRSQWILLCVPHHNLWCHAPLPRDYQQRPHFSPQRVGNTALWSVEPTLQSDPLKLTRCSLRRVAISRVVCCITIHDIASLHSSVACRWYVLVSFITFYTV